MLYLWGLKIQNSETILWQEGYLKPWLPDFYKSFSTTLSYYFYNFMQFLEFNPFQVNA